MAAFLWLRGVVTFRDVGDVFLAGEISPLLDRSRKVGMARPNP